MFKYNLYTLVNHSISISSKLANCQYHFPPKYKDKNHKQKLPCSYQKSQTERPIPQSRSSISLTKLNWKLNSLRGQPINKLSEKAIMRKNFFLQKTYKLNLPSFWSWSETRREINPEHLKIIGGEKEMSIFALTTNATRVLCPEYLKIFLREKEMSIFVWVPNGRPGIDNKC